ncbi:hypothetical protein H6S65_gp81 [Pseudomonas phage datas]|uniref:Uncharacterized protein n=1 Tax=Pseudomonas phage datas TaxID=2719601 RepID=A0A6G9LQI9_9CAUD|nr:hypothetical protein H6S65_gp81 [Pseudomonas phage datas]QIQ67646.1 hypothetical protein chumba_84 [Pseudomonas phage chumba]QIQ67920.1 hypothetical protein datas_81 [Pseudomonas phage datas]
MFDFHFDGRDKASLEVDPGTFYVVFGFGQNALIWLTYIDGELSLDMNKWLPEPKQEDHNEQVQ